MLSSDTITFQLSFRTCVVMKCPCALSHGTSSPKFLHLAKEKLSSRWKTGLKLLDQGTTHSGCLRMAKPFVVKAVSTIPQLDKAVTDSQVDRINVNNESQSRSRRVPLEDLKEIDPRNYERRLRISIANKGKVPWNKGKKHTAETIARIRERTREAMQDLKVRKKLAGLSHPQSEETRKKIGLSVKRLACKRRKRRKMQETCLHEWEESLAEAARIGGDGEDELQWDSYEILKEKIHQDWLQFAAMRKRSPRAPKPAQQKKKISEAIRAKWADPEYRQRVQAGVMKHRENRPPPTRRVTVKQTSKVDLKLLSCKTEAKTPAKTPTKTPAKTLAKTPAKIPAILSEYEQLLENYRMKSPDPYSDPLAIAKLDKIKQLRENREAIERRKREAVERARLLIAEAEKAAQALEAAAVIDDTARASLFETRKLLAEAVQALKSVQSDICPKEHTLIKDPDMLKADTLMDGCHMAASAAFGPGDQNGTTISSFTSNDCRENNYDNYKSTVRNFLNGRLSGSLFDNAYKYKPSHSTEIDEDNFFSYATRLFSTSDLSADETNHSFNLETDKRIEKDSMSHSEDDSAPTLTAVNYAGMVGEPIVSNTAEKHMPEHMKENAFSIATNSFTCKGPIQSSIGASNSRSTQNDCNDLLASNKGCKKRWVSGKLVEVEGD